MKNNLKTIAVLLITCFLVNASAKDQNIMSAIDIEKMTIEIDKEIKLSGKNFEPTDEFDYSAIRKQIQNRIEVNKESYKNHFAILKDLKEDTIINFSRISKVIATGYLAYGLFAGPIIGTFMADSTIIGGGLTVTAGTFVGVASFVETVQIIVDFNEYTPKNIAISLNSHLNQEERLRVIQYLDYIVKHLDKSFEEALDFKWYHYLLQSHAPFEKALQVLHTQIILDSLNLELLNTVN
ncbi:MAG: hypothetical protein MK008_07915 [Bdellovibrionales bacterium]|nr:hypothetical protein [Bdellovibrionales bacterium]